MRKVYFSDELYHHGVLGQKWGVRRYQNYDGTLKESAKKEFRERDKKKQEEAFQRRKGLKDSDYFDMWTTTGLLSLIAPELAMPLTAITLDSISRGENWVNPKKKQNTSDLPKISKKSSETEKPQFSGAFDKKSKSADEIKSKKKNDRMLSKNIDNVKKLSGYKELYDKHSEKLSNGLTNYMKHPNKNRESYRSQLKDARADVEKYLSSVTSGNSELNKRAADKIMENISGNNKHFLWTDDKNWNKLMR